MASESLSMADISYIWKEPFPRMDFRGDENPLELFLRVTFKNGEYISLQLKSESDTLEGLRDLYQYRMAHTNEPYPVGCCYGYLIHLVLDTLHKEHYSLLVEEEHSGPNSPKWISKFKKKISELELVLKIANFQYHKVYFGYTMQNAMIYINSRIDKKSFKEVMKTPCKPGSALKGLPIDMMREIMSYI